MKQILFWAAAAVLVVLLIAGRATAQTPTPTSVQRLNFAFFNDYEADIFGTNSVLTNESSIIRTAAVTTGNVYRALYYEEGQEWTNLEGYAIVREVNLTNGAEGIFLRANGKQTNISDYFTNSLGKSYLDDFTGEVTNEFAGATNNFPSDLPFHKGLEQFRMNKATVTNNLRSEQLYFMSLNTTNLKFNFLAYGTAVPNPVVGRLTPKGPIISNSVDVFTLHGIGTMARTGNSNIFDAGAVPPITTHGIIYGTVWSSQPVFELITNGP